MDNKTKQVVEIVKGLEAPTLDDIVDRIRAYRVSITAKCYSVFAAEDMGLIEVIDKEIHPQHYRLTQKGREI